MGDYSRTLIVLDQPCATSGPKEIRSTCELVEHLGYSKANSRSFFAACQAVDSIAGRKDQFGDYKVFVIHKDELEDLLRKQLERNNLEYTFIDISNIEVTDEWTKNIFKIHEAIVEAKACSASYKLMVRVPDGN